MVLEFSLAGLVWFVIGVVVTLICGFVYTKVKK